MECIPFALPFERHMYFFLNSFLHPLREIIVMTMLKSSCGNETGMHKLELVIVVASSVKISDKEVIVFISM